MVGAARLKGMRCVAVMPAWQEAPRIAEAVRGVLPHVDALIVVDDGSRDGTAEAARLDDARVMVLRHAVNRGQGAALRTGTEAAVRLGADIIVHVDADGQHDPEGIPALIRPLVDGAADVAFGSRFLDLPSEGMPFFRRIFLSGVRFFNVFVLGISQRMTDPQSGLRALTRRAAREIRFNQDRFAHCSEILRRVTRSSLTWVEVPTRIRYTTDSLAKGQKTTDAFKVAWDLFLGVFRH